MKEKSKNNGLVVALVIFIIISLCLGGFIGCDKLINKSQEENIQVLQLAPFNGTAVLIKEKYM